MLPQPTKEAVTAALATNLFIRYVVSDESTVMTRNTALSRLSPRQTGGFEDWAMR